MARNEEKNLARLNRLLLQNQKEEYLKKNPPRPKLETLTTAEEIKKWLPSIKKDIDFNLKQSQVPCYPDRKIKEFTDKIDHLQRLYKAFVRKLKEVDPQLDCIPWIDRGYESRKRHVNEEQDVIKDAVFDDEASKQRKLSERLEEGIPTENIFTSEIDKQNSETDDHNSENVVTCDSVRTVNCNKFVPIKTPILDNEYEHRSISGFSEPRNSEINVNKELQDEPLSFKKDHCSNYHQTQRLHEIKNMPTYSDKKSNNLMLSKSETNNSVGTYSGSKIDTIGGKNHQQNVTVLSLNLPYSDSDDSDCV